MRMKACPGLQGAHNLKDFVFLEDNVDSSIYRSVLLEHHDSDSQRILCKSFLKSKKIKKTNPGPHAV